MAKMQRRWVTGNVYWVIGAGKRERRIKLIGKGKINGREALFFHPLRKASKTTR